MKIKSSIPKIFLVSTATMTCVSALVMGAFWVSHEYDFFERESRQIRERDIASQKQRIRQETEQVAGYVAYMRSQMENRLRARIRNRVYDAYTIAMNLYAEHGHAMSDAEVGKMIKNVLRPIRFNNGRGYYFATRLSGIEARFADRPEPEGTDVLSVQDTLDPVIIKDMIDIVKRSEEGFYEYTWTKPDVAGRDFPKIAFVKHFEPLNWLIGTGEYLDDVERDIQKEVLAYIESISVGKDGYFFASQWDGLSLTEPGKGLNMYEVTDVNGLKIVQELIKTAKAGGGSVEYVMPKFEGHRPLPKISYVRPVADWEWYIGAGVYVDDIEEMVGERAVVLKRDLKAQMWRIGEIFVIALVFVFAIASVLSRRLRQEFAVFRSFFEQASTSEETATVDPDQLHFAECAQLASSVNKMIARRRQAEEALRESEERFRELADTLPQTVFETDEKGMLTFANRKAFKAFGYTQDAFDKGLNAFEMLAAENRKDAARKFLARMGGQDLGGSEYTAQRKDGSTFPVILHSAPIIRGGEPAGLRGILVDMTERKRMEQEMVRTQRLRAAGELSAGVSHNLNNILTGVLGPAQMLQMITEDPDVLREAAVIISSTLRARDLVHRLHLSTRGIDEDNLRAVPVNEVIQEAIRAARPRWKDEPESKGISIAVVTELEDVPLIMGAESRLHDIFMNLLLNAVDAMPRGGTITICTQVASDGVQITVRDTGIGMDEEIRQRVFEPFFTTKKDVGSGLGLSTAYGAVTRWGGRIEVESESGMGTVFTLQLPAWTGPVVEEQVESEIRQVRRASLLIVEDDGMVCTVLSRLLENHHEVVVVQTGQEALRTFAPGCYDVALVDLGMPGMPGDLVAREMKAKDPFLATVLITGWEIDDHDSRASAFDFRIQKPFERLSLVRNTVAMAVALRDARSKAQ